MQTKHTPGPWYIDKPYNEPGTYIAGPNTGLIAKLYPTDSYMWNGDKSVSIEANARLIAASPAMLEALTQIIEDFDPEIGRVTNASINKARAAIAKAAGK